MPSQPTKSVSINPKVVVSVIVALVLVVLALENLRSNTALFALACITVAAFAVWSKISPKIKLTGLGVCFGLVLLSNTVEGWQERKELERQEQVRKQVAAWKAKQEQKVEEAFRQLSPREHLDQARTSLGVGLPSSNAAALKHLSAIPASVPEFEQANQLRQQYEMAKKRREQEQARIQAVERKQSAENEAAAKRIVRDFMAKTLETKMLDEGYDVDVSAIGKDHTTLHIKWILVSKVLAHQLSKEGEFFQNAREAGFKRIEISDGYDESWYWKLN
jgi:flagellar biosynthesis GTPase FlhF